MVLGDIVSLVFGSRSPVDDELLLADAIVDPVETHVDGLGAFLLDLAIGEADGCRVVGLDGGGRLWVPKFLEGDA